jgi:hypothetical protein
MVHLLLSSKHTVFQVRIRISHDQLALLPFLYDDIQLEPLRVILSQERDHIPSL